MSSLVLPRKKNTDFLAPSKTLQDAKKKLGVIYFDSKLIECPQNAVELTKLLKEWDELDKQKYKIVEETKRKQRILLKSINSHYAVKESTTSLEKESDVCLVDVKLPPAGFRFHSDGEPKLKQVELDSSLSSTVSFARTPSRVTSGGLYSSQDLNLNMKKSSTKSLNNSSDGRIPKIDSDIDYKKEIQQLESVIDDLTTDLANSRLTEEYERKFDIKSHSMSFLRAHSRDKIGISNHRYYFDPSPSSSFKHGTMGKRSIENKSHNSCTACQFKLKHSTADYEKLKNVLTKPCLRKWHIAPSGTFTESKADINRVESRLDKASKTSSVNLYKYSRGNGVTTTQSHYQPLSASEDREEIALGHRKNVKSAPFLARNVSFARQMDLKPSMEVLKQIAVRI